MRRLPGHVTAGLLHWSSVISVNQRHQLEWQHEMTVSDVLRIMRYSYPQLVVTVDGHIVGADHYATFRVPDRADVRVIHLMAGG